MVKCLDEISEAGMAASVLYADRFYYILFFDILLL